MAFLRKISLFLLRVSLGWLFFYAGITKLLNPSWSAADYIRSAKTFPELYSLFLRPDVLPVINFLNEWGLTLIGAALMLGIFVKFSSIMGALMMFFYYLAALKFPYIGTTSFLVDQHIIFILVLLFFAGIGAGRAWGLDSWCSKLPICSKFPKIRNLIG